MNIYLQHICVVLLFSVFTYAVPSSTLLTAQSIVDIDSLVPSQDTFPMQLQLQLDVSTGVATIELDKFKNLYSATLDNRILRFDSLGNKSIFEYSNNRMGIPQYIDASNPLNVLLYYFDFQTIIFLSRTLTPESILQLSNLGYVQVPVIATAADGNIWLMDMLDFKLKKITPEGRLIRESQELNLLVEQFSQPTQILDTGDHVYIVDKQVGILQLDGFGQFIKSIEANDIHSLGAMGDYLLYTRGQEIVFTHTKVTEEKRFLLPFNVQIHLGGKYFSLIDNGKISVYCYK